jgi:predicted RNA-binding protein with TRAM domain
MQSLRESYDAGTAETKLTESQLLPDWMQSSLGGLARSKRTKTALKIVRKLLKPRGNFVAKVFQGDMFIDYLNELRKEFSSVHAYSPPVSWKESAETYVVAKRLLTGPVRKVRCWTNWIDSVGKSGDGVAVVEGFAIIMRGAKLGEKLRVKIDAVSLISHLPLSRWERVDNLSKKRKRKGEGYGRQRSDIRRWQTGSCPTFVVKGITIGTEAIPNEEGKTVNVSSMEIDLAKQEWRNYCLSKLI